MPSDRQLAANRLNAQKSTGPRTLEGKARASQNALKTGVHAESQIIRGETAEAFQALTAGYYDEYQPATASQRALVDTMISNEWLLRRLRRVEAGIWNQGLQFIKDSYFQPKDHPEASTYSSQDEILARLQRRLDSLDRAWHRALKALRQIQADEAAGRQQPAPEPRPNKPAILEPTGTGSLPLQIGFVPSTFQASPDSKSLPHILCGPAGSSGLPKNTRDPRRDSDAVVAGMV